jgi:hypothetical protein
MDDEEFLRQFEECTLPFDQWTHRSHVKVTFLYLRQFPYDQALTRIRSGIQNYNAAHRIPEGPNSGYNETTTQGFVRLIAVTMQAFGPAFPTPNADSFCDTHPQLMTRCALRFFYSPEARMQPLAKTEFVEPDLAPLPTLRVRTDAS